MALQTIRIPPKRRSCPLPSDCVSLLLITSSPIARSLAPAANASNPGYPAKKAWWIRKGFKGMDDNNNNGSYLPVGLMEEQIRVALDFIDVLRV